MKNCIQIALGVVLGVMFISACRTQSDSALPDSGGADRVYPDVLAEFEWSVPTLHETFWEAASLSTRTWHGIHRRSTSVIPSGTKIWFALNIPGPGDIEHKRRYWKVNVYFTPEEVSGRVCRGRFIRLKGGETRKPFLEGYWHVLPEGIAFTNRLPSSSSLPFTVNGNLLELEVLSLVDMVRAKGGGRIVSIQAQVDGSALVRTATSTAFLASRGKRFDFEKKNGEWVMVKEWDWES